MKEIIVLNSGGLDSLIAIKMLHDLGYKQHSVYGDFGQPNGERAKESAKRIAKKYCVSHEVLTFSSDSRDSFSFYHEIDKDKAPTTAAVPYTRFLFVMLGAMLTRLDRYEYLSLGGFKPVTKNQTPLSYLMQLDYLLNDNLTQFLKIKLIYPFENINSIDDELEQARIHHLTKEEMDETVSCNCKEPCGKCAKCLMRNQKGIKMN